MKKKNKNANVDTIKKMAMLLRNLLVLVSLFSFINCQSSKSKKNALLNERDTVQSKIHHRKNTMNPLEMLLIRDTSSFVINHLKRNQILYDSLLDNEIISIEKYFKPYQSYDKIDTLKLEIQGVLKEMITYKDTNGKKYLIVSEYMDKDPSLNSTFYNQVKYKLYSSSRDSLLWEYSIDNTEVHNCESDISFLTDIDNDKAVELNLFMYKGYGGLDPSINYYLFKIENEEYLIYDYEFLNDEDISFNIRKQLSVFPENIRIHMWNNWERYYFQKYEKTYEEQMKNKTKQ